MRVRFASLLVTAAVTLIATPAFATCRIHNDTKWSFKVDSGNTLNQTVDAHSTTSIAAGKIKGKDEKAGKTISGSCKEGDELDVKEDGDVPLLTVK